MRIHVSEDVLKIHVWDAARAASVDLHRFTEHGSRSRHRAYDVILTGDAAHRINGRGYDLPFAASWDQWGIFLAHLFELDPTMKCWAYDGADEFHDATCGRFLALRSVNDAAYHRRHKWDYAAPRTFTCACGAGQSYVIREEANA